MVIVGVRYGEPGDAVSDSRTGRAISNNQLTQVAGENSLQRPNILVIWSVVGVLSNNLRNN